MHILRVHTCVWEHTIYPEWYICNYGIYTKHKSSVGCVCDVYVCVCVCVCVCMCGNKCKQIHNKTCVCAYMRVSMCTLNFLHTFESKQNGIYALQAACHLPVCVYVCVCVRIYVSLSFSLSHSLCFSLCLCLHVNIGLLLWSNHSLSV